MNLTSSPSEASPVEIANHDSAFGSSTKGSKVGFTLTEVILAMAIIASALMAVLAILPTGLDVSRNAMDHSIVATILEDVNQRLQGERLEIGVPNLSPAYFDEFGVLIPPTAPAAELAQKRVYRADIVIVNPLTTLPHTTDLKYATIKLSWPLTGTGEAVGPQNPRISATYGITTLSGRDWGQIDNTYVPKIGL